MRTLQKQIIWHTRAQWALAALMITTVLAFWWFGYRPQTQRLAVLRGTIVSRQTELAENQRRAAKRNEIAARNDKLKAELERLKKPSKQQELPELIKELDRGKAQASLRRYE